MLFFRNLTEGRQWQIFGHFRRFSWYSYLLPIPNSTLKNIKNHCRSVASEASEGTTLYNRTVIRFSDGRFWVNFQLPRILRKHTSRTLFDSKLVPIYRKSKINSLYEVKFVDTTNGLAATTKKAFDVKRVYELKANWSFCVCI